MSHHITSDTEIDPISIDVYAGHAEVMLRTDITHEGDVWEATEVTGIMPEDTTIEYVEDHFYALWEIFELGSMTPHQIAEAVVNAILGMMGGSFLEVASKSLRAGDVTFGGQSMFVATRSIATGEKLVDGVNAIKTSVSDILNALHIGDLVSALQ